jgi:hypothetical protein
MSICCIRGSDRKSVSNCISRACSSGEKVTAAPPLRFGLDPTLVVFQMSTVRNGGFHQGWHRLCDGSSSARRTKLDFVAFVCRLLRRGYAHVCKVHLVLDNLMRAG